MKLYSFWMLFESAVDELMCPQGLKEEELRTEVGEFLVDTVQ